MVPTKLMAELVRHVDQAGAKLVLAGDQGQIQAIQAGGPVRLDLRANPRRGEAHRNSPPAGARGGRRPSEQLSKGEAKEALVAYAAHGQLHVTETRDEAIARIVDLWKASGGASREQARDVFIVTPLNCEVRAINRLCQAERLRAGEISERNIKLAGQKIHEHDRVVLTKKDRGLQVENGFTGEVVSFDDDGRKITVRLDKGGREVALPVEEYGADRIRPGVLLDRAHLAGLDPRDGPRAPGRAHDGPAPLLRRGLPVEGRDASRVRPRRGRQGPDPEGRHPHDGPGHVQGPHEGPGHGPHRPGPETRGAGPRADEPGPAAAEGAGPLLSL